MANQLDRTFLVISRLQADEEKKELYKEKANKYFNECGCSLGGIFLVAAFFGCGLYLVFFHHNMISLLKSIGVIFFTSILGKLSGIISARIKLYILLKRLSGKINK